MTEGINTDDMLGVYLFENQQLLERLQEIVLRYKDEPEFDEDAIHEIFRMMHTMKASSGIMMYDGISSVAHKLEDVFSVLRDEKPVNVPHLELIDCVLKVADFITEELNHIKDGESEKGDASSIILHLDVLLKKIQAESYTKEQSIKCEKETVTQKYYIAPQKKEAEETEEPLFMIDLESSVEEIEARMTRTQEKIIVESRFKVLEPGDFVIDSKDYGRAKQFVQEKPEKREVVTYVKVDVTKVNHLVNLMEKLESAQLAVLENEDLNVPGLELEHFHKASAKWQKLSKDLRNVIWSMRMETLESTFQRLNRMVFDASRKLGKNIDFVMSGKETELDRSIIDQISDALTHLVRNAIDHGIESPEGRYSAGKSDCATITVSAYTDEDFIYISVADDGKGIDRDLILKQAHQKGLLDAERADESYTERDVFQLITLPGFSTKEEVTEFSGRGVGMDVVVSNLAFIEGSLEIESEKGRGSRMTIKIPLSTARFMEA